MKSTMLALLLTNTKEQTVFQSATKLLEKEKERVPRDRHCLVISIDVPNVCKYVLPFLIPKNNRKFPHIGISSLVFAYESF